MSLSLEQASGGTMCLAAGGLTVGTGNAYTLKTANTINYTINGVFKTAKTTSDNIPHTAPTGFVVTTPVTAGNKCSIGLWLDASGNFRVTQGPLTPYTASTDTAAPPPNPGLCLVGIAVVTAATATFTPGTTNYAAAGTTVNYYDVMTLQATGLA